MSQPGRPLPFQPRGAYDGKVADSKLADVLLTPESDEPVLLPEAIQFLAVNS